MIPSEVQIKVAVARLLKAPTGALVEPRPTSPALLSRDGIAGWHSAGMLADTEFARGLAAAYSADAGTPHLAVGGVCGIQTYTARFAVVVLGTWLQTGSVLDLRPNSWAFALDEAGHTVAVDPPLTGAQPNAPVGQVAEGLLDHLRPFIAAVRDATRITERVALSSVAAACSGAFSSIHRCMDSDDRAVIARLADRFLADPVFEPGGRLLDRREVRASEGSVLVHERRVCCLIHLGSDKDACHTCPRLDPAQRRAGILQRAAAAPQSQELRLAPIHKEPL